MIMVKTLRRISASDSFDLKHANQETDHGGTELALGRDWTVGLGFSEIRSKLISPRPDRRGARVRPAPVRAGRERTRRGGPVRLTDVPLDTLSG